MLSKFLEVGMEFILTDDHEVPFLIGIDCYPGDVIVVNELKNTDGVNLVTVTKKGSSISECFAIDDNSDVEDRLSGQFVN